MNGEGALAALLADPVFEIMPLVSVSDALPSLPAGARVSITASPARGLDATLDLSEELAAAGFRVIPHVAAHYLRDEGHLAEVLERVAAAGITAAFVAGGDVDQAGPYADALSVLEAMAEQPNRPPDVGIAAHPQGHPDIPADALASALTAKAPHATWATTQLCFNVTALAAWIRARRAEGLTLPLWIGVPGVVDAARLLRVALRIGVTDAAGYVDPDAGTYRPDALLAELAPLLADPSLGIQGLHLYSFNEVAATESWRAHFLENLRA